MALAKRIVPQSLLGRSLLMILLPLLLLQAVTFQIFYGSHIEVVSRRLSSAIAGEVAFTVEAMGRFDDQADSSWLLDRARLRFGLEMSFEAGAHLGVVPKVNLFGPMDEDLEAALREAIRSSFTVDWSTDPRSVLVNVQVTDGVLHVIAPRKRLYTMTTYFFIPWILGTALLLFAIAAMFMGNQVRGIKRLASSAEAFGLGRETPPIRPEGASEVRQAAVAFNRMQERIRRYLTQRTEMLAGVSHDLRTPLTRLRLALAMLQKQYSEMNDFEEMIDDVREMERMIADYLGFARGEGTEQAVFIDLGEMLGEITAAARRGGAQVNLDIPKSLPIFVRPVAVRRALTNLVDNARRHADQITITAQAGHRIVYICIEDNGPGIVASRREDVFRPFESGSSGGTGLGLAIARDIVRAHGGDIILGESQWGGLQARIHFPT